MTTRRPGPAALHSVPTLTEVIEIADLPAEHTGEGEQSIPAAGPEPQFSEEMLVQRVLADIQRQTDLMLEVRLREAVTPALARLTDSLIREMRTELSATLREVVARAVALEVARHRNR